MVAEPTTSEPPLSPGMNTRYRDLFSKKLNAAIWAIHFVGQLTPSWVRRVRTCGSGGWAIGWKDPSKLARNMFMSTISSLMYHEQAAIPARSLSPSYSWAVVPTKIVTAASVWPRARIVSPLKRYAQLPHRTIFISWPLRSLRCTWRLIKTPLLFGRSKDSISEIAQMVPMTSTKHPGCTVGTGKHENGVNEHDHSGKTSAKFSFSRTTVECVILIANGMSTGLMILCFFTKRNLLISFQIKNN